MTYIKCTLSIKNRMGTIRWTGSVRNSRKFTKYEGRQLKKARRYNGRNLVIIATKISMLLRISKQRIKL